MLPLPLRILSLSHSASTRFKLFTLAVVAALATTPAFAPALAHAAEPATTSATKSAAAPAAAPHEGRGLTFIENDYAAALNEARTRNVPLFVDAWAPWCHTCVFMREHVLSRPELARHNPRFVFLSIDTEHEHSAPFVEKFPVESWPTLFIIDPTTESVRVKWLGTLDSDGFARLLDDGERAVADAAARKESSLAKADALFGGGKAVAAAKAYRALLDTSTPVARPRTAVSLVLALFDAAEYADCARTASAEAGHLAARGPTPPEAARTTAIRDTTALAALATWGLVCAGYTDPGELDAATTRTIIETGADTVELPGLLGDDRSSLYEALVAAYAATGNVFAAKKAAARWLTFLETEAAAARSPAARAVYDAHRVAAALALGQPERALAAVQQSGKDLPSDYNPPAREALLLKELRRYDDALAAVTRAERLVYGPRTIRVLELRAAIHTAKGDTASRDAALNAAIAAAEKHLRGTRHDDTVARLRKHLAGSR